MMKPVYCILWISAILSDLTTCQDSPQRCIAGRYHKPSPSPEGDGYVKCHAWQHNTCCDANLTKELLDHDVLNLYNITYDMCGHISYKCRRYLQQEACFFECEPNTIDWTTPNNKTYRNVPICASYCDAWFDACKHDRVCFVNWLTDYTIGEDGIKRCPPDKPCKTYAEIYHNGAGICNLMWGSTYRYETSSNCMVMDFDPEGPNPNDQVAAPAIIG